MGDGAVEANIEDSGTGDNDAPLTLNQLAQLERQKGIKFPDALPNSCPSTALGRHCKTRIASPYSAALTL